MRMYSYSRRRASSPGREAQRDYVNSAPRVCITDAAAAAVGSGSAS